MAAFGAEAISGAFARCQINNRRLFESDSPVVALRRSLSGVRRVESYRGS